jgi:hypothetical protein
MPTGPAQHRRVTRRREVPLVPSMTPHAEPLPVGQLRLQGMRVSETAGEVSITIYGLPVPPRSLIASGIVYVAVTLGEPLGERRLIDGADE